LLPDDELELELEPPLSRTTLGLRMPRADVCFRRGSQLVELEEPLEPLPDMVTVLVVMKSLDMSCW